MKRTMMKSAAFATAALVAAFAAADTVKVTVDGTPVNFDAALPETINGRVLVPLRGVFEQMGANVDWDASSQTIVAMGNHRRVRLQIGTFDANVNGRVVTMDVAPQIISGSTMVPLRFLGQALGAKVDWEPENQLVAITTRHDEGAAQTIVTPPPPPPKIVVPPPTVIIREVPKPTPPVVITPPPPPPPPFVFNRDTVIPLRLDMQVSSNGNKQGDHFTATVRGEGDRYLDFPHGTFVEGYVRSATPASGDHAGTLDIRFTHIKFPDGNEYKVGGVIMMLNDKDIVKTNDGRYIAKGGENEVARDAEIGAGAGLLIGSTKGKAVGGAVVGGTVGAIVGIFDKRVARNVIFDKDTKFGLVLGRDLEINRADLRSH